MTMRLLILGIDSSEIILKIKYGLLRRNRLSIIMIYSMEMISDV